MDKMAQERRLARLLDHLTTTTSPTTSPTTRGLHSSLTSSSSSSTTDAAFDIVHAHLLDSSSSSFSSSSLLLTCEHASGTIPPPWDARWQTHDAWLTPLHWNVDIGAEQLTRELCARVNCVAVVACFSRLVCDANRLLDSDTLFRSVADGRPVHLNLHITDDDRELRLRRLYHPYHEAVDRAARILRPRMIISMHSFTPNYEGQKRVLEVGVLFSDDGAIAAKINGDLRRAGFVSELNQPWSGKEGFMYSASHHAQTQGDRAGSKVEALMVEVRQDLIIHRQWRDRFLDVFLKSLKELDFQ